MNTTFRNFDYSIDFEKVGQFLIDQFQLTPSSSSSHVNWPQPRWEYMHFHPLIRGVDRSTIGVWESDGEIAAVAHLAHPGSPVYFQIRKGAETLKPELIKYANEQLLGRTVQNGERPGFYINSEDDDFSKLAAESGFSPSGDREPMSTVVADHVSSSSPLPEGFKFTSLNESNCLTRVHRLLYRGFDNGDEPQDDGIADRKFMQTAPNFRPELNVIAIAPNGDWASYAGIWFDPVNRIGYVEPVATDPEYRLRGIGKATVIESIRRVKLLGATHILVGSTLPIYKSIGFRETYALERWFKV